MKTKLSSDVSSVREAAREIVRELGILGDVHSAQQLTNSQAHSLIELELHTSLSVNELSGILRLEKSSVSRLLQDLLKRKLVAIETEPTDLRKKIFRLTSLGRALLNRVDAEANARVDAALRTLTVAERKLATAGLLLYARALKGSRQ